MVALGAGVVVGLVVSGDDDDASSDGSAVLFVQQAASGEYQPADDTGDATLVLRGVAPRTAYFSDRPERDAGSVSTRALVDSSDLFSDDPPNAALVVDDTGSAVDDEAAFIVELRDPVYDAEAATVLYRVRPLTSPSDGLASFSARRGTPPDAFGHASLFIDSSDLPPGPTGPTATSGGATGSRGPEGATGPVGPAGPLGSDTAGVQISVVDANGVPLRDATVSLACPDCLGTAAPDPMATDDSGNVTFVIDLDGEPRFAASLVVTVNAGSATATADVDVTGGTYTTVALTLR